MTVNEIEGLNMLLGGRWRMMAATAALIAVPGGWMIDDDENIYLTQAEARAAR